MPGESLLIRAFALQQRSIQVETDSDAIVGVSTVVQIISVTVVVHVYVIVVVPIAVPVFRPGIHQTEPIAAVMEASMSADIPYLEIGEAEPVVLAIVATETVLRNAVTAVTAALLPRAVLRLPAMCTRTLPGDLLLADLSRAPSLSIRIGLLLLAQLPLLILLTPGLLLLLLSCGVVLLLTMLPLLILLPARLLFRRVVLLLALALLILLVAFRLGRLFLSRRFILFLLFIWLVLPCAYRTSDREYQKKRCRTDDSNWFHALSPLNLLKPLRVLRRADCQG